VPAGLNNVVSIAIEGDANWAIKRDGTVTKWGGEPDAANVVASLSNIISITYTAYKGYLALKNDGIVLGFASTTTACRSLPDSTNGSAGQSAWPDFEQRRGGGLDTT